MIKIPQKTKKISRRCQLNGGRNRRTSSALQDEDEDVSTRMIRIAASPTFNSVDTVGASTVLVTAAAGSFRCPRCPRSSF